MGSELKFFVIVWSVLCGLVLVGTTALKISSTPKEVSIDLKHNKSIEISVFRIFPHLLRIEIQFSPNKSEAFNELGIYKTVGNWHETGYLEFPEPGIPLKVSISINGKKIIYEALPINKHYDRLYRALVPFIDDGNSQNFSWPQSKSNFHELHSGFNNLTISFIDIGKETAKEKVSIIINPPVDFKVVANNYGFLWLFYFWPIYALLLGIFGVVLLEIHRKMEKRRSNIQP
jgi:hypothetical protein